MNYFKYKGKREPDYRAYRGSTCRLSILLLSLIPLTSAHAQRPLSYAELIKARQLVQTSQNEPTQAQYRMLASLHYFSSVFTGDDSATLTYTNSMGPQTINLSGRPSGARYVSPGYADLSILDGVFPETTYTFNSIGDSSVTSASLTLPANAFPDKIPYLTGDTYSRLQNIDVAQDFLFTWSGYTPPDGYSGEVYYNIHEQFGPQYPISPLPPDATSAVLPANTFKQAKIIRCIFSIQTHK